jgi:hypothetical protein
MGEFMRVATFVLGIAIAIAGGASEASDTGGSSRSAQPAAAIEGVLRAPATERFITPNTSAWLNAQDENFRRGALGAMGFVPPHGSALNRTRPFGEAAAQHERPYNPATTPLPRTRTLEDHLLTGFVALMLIAYQLRRKHRFLRPHQFSI